MNERTKCGISTQWQKREWSANVWYNMDEPWKIMLRKRSHTQKATYYMILSIRTIQIRQIHRDRSVLATARDWKVGVRGSDYWCIRDYFLAWWKCSRIRWCWWSCSSECAKKTPNYRIEWFLWSISYISINLLRNGKPWYINYSSSISAGLWRLMKLSSSVRQFRE